jgi:acetoacetyl-CoA synthetase
MNEQFPILRQPNDYDLNRSHMARFMRWLEDRGHGPFEDYQALHDWSVENLESFWASIWEYTGVIASQPYERVLADRSMPGAQWFPGARLNFAQNLLRYKDDRPAIVFRGENGRHRELTYAELRDQVARVAAALREAGVERGDRVAGFMPNIPETVIAMLATTSIGAIWSSCSPDFGVNGTVDRFGQIEPKVLFTADGYFYNGKNHDSLDRVRAILEKMPAVERVVVVPFRDDTPDIGGVPNAVLLDDFMPGGEAPELKFEQLPFDHPLYIMYSSGTTGAPKCIVHGAGGTLIQHLKELVLHTDLRREDRIIYFTTCGWMMWNWLVSSLAVGATVVLYDGSPFHPDGRTLWDLIDELGITVFGTAAKYIAAVEKAGLKPRESHDLGSLRTILSTGSPLLPESFDFVYRDVKENLCLSSISGGTDIISCFALGCPTLPVYRGELQCIGLGMKVTVLNEDDQRVRGEPGELACSLPFPSMPVGFWNDPDDQRFHDAYFSRAEGYWCHGDHAEIVEHPTQDGLIIHGRSDATLNPGGIRIGTAEIYRQVEKHDEVLESLAIGQKWKDDERVVLFVKLRDGVELDDEMRDAIKKTIRANATPRHVPAKILQAPDIPKTINGKITELAVRSVIHGKPVKNKDALANPESLDFFENLPELQED